MVASDDKGGRVRAGALAHVCLCVGLGLCWVMEALVVTGMTSNVPQADEPFSFFYSLQSPSLIVCALLMMFIPRIETFLSSTRVQAVIVLLALVDLLLMFVLPKGSIGATIGVQFFSIIPLVINFLWFCILGQISSKYADRCILGTAAAQAVLLPALSSLDVRAALPIAAICLILSYAAVRIVQTSLDDFLPDHQPMQTRVFSHQMPVIVGILILMMCATYLRMAGSEFNTANAMFTDLPGHLITIVLIIALIYIVKDTERTLTVKVTVFFSIIAMAGVLVIQPVNAVSVQVIAGVQGMFDIIAFVALAQMTYYGFVRRGFALGAYQLVMIIAMILGYAFFLLSRSTLLAGYPPVLELVLLAVLVFAALWLLTEDRVFAFLWGRPVGEAGEAAVDGGFGEAVSSNVPEDTSEDGGQTVRSADSANRDDPVAEVARECGLTDRERDVLELLAKGRSSTYIAEQLVVSKNTVRSHISHIYAKCNVHSRQEIITLIDARS